MEQRIRYPLAILFVGGYILQSAEARTTRISLLKILRLIEVSPMADLLTRAFLTLRSHFFESPRSPDCFPLREKRNTQDNPFDEYVAEQVLSEMDGVQCERSGPLTSPDLVLYRSEKVDGASKSELTEDLDAIVGLEVKKLERTDAGNIARASGLDYNTTPPSGHVQVYDSDDTEMKIRSFYLFVCSEECPENAEERAVTALTLVDGKAINRDYEFYKKITGSRQKDIGLGSYGDGMDRNRPMLVFPNPLGADRFDHEATLVHESDGLESQVENLDVAYELERTLSDGGTVGFACYRLAGDIPASHKADTLADPFPSPSDRSRSTSQRAKFNLPVSVSGSGKQLSL